MDAGAGIERRPGPWVAAGFEEVRSEFERNFEHRGELGAAVAAYWRGEKVVDLWGGRRAATGDAPWSEDTMVAVNSTTKGLAAMTFAVANSRGWLDYDAAVAEYWPEFAENGKGAITVRQLLGHEAGLVRIDEPLRPEDLRDLDRVARLIARQRPVWEPGTRHGYHAITLGLYMQEVIRRADPAHRTLGRVFHEEIAVPLEIDFYIGLPPEVPDERLAKLSHVTRGRWIRSLAKAPVGFLRRALWPRSLLRTSMQYESLDVNDRAWLEVESPASNGVGTARAIARAYSAFAEGGSELGITEATLAMVTAVPAVDRPTDAVLGVPRWMSLGYQRPGPRLSFGSSERAFGTPGGGGSFAYADPDARLAFAYVMNSLDGYIFDDPREKALRDAVHRAVGRLSSADGQRQGP
jgi:CubicO group peptidase (beta-lactamase class C family)